MANKAFTGKIISRPHGKRKQRATLLKFEMSLFTPEFTETFMSNFQELDLSEREKKSLSRAHRSLINQYKKISPFSLNKDKNNLLQAICESDEKTITVEASEYGAYICLAAAYSGKLPSNKKIKFVLSSSPIALFPKSFIKSNELPNNCEIVYCIKSEHWFDEYESLYQNNYLKFSLTAA